MIAEKSKTGPADLKWGYPFGVDGVVGSEAAAALLDCHRTTLYTLCNDGKIRRGKLNNRAKFCRRSITDYLRSLEV